MSIYFLKYQAKNLSINAYLIILKSSTMTEKKYLKSLNWFRGIAIIFVFLSHVPKGEINGITANFLHSFFGNGTFYFVFISGYLFWHLKDRFEYIGYIKNKIKNVILPYLFVLTPVLILYGILEVNLDTPNEVLFSGLLIKNGLIWHLLVGGMAANPPLWFIPMIIIFFITSPIIYSLSESKYFNILLLITIVFSILSFRPDTLQYPLYSYFHFYGVYLFGIFCKKNERLVFYHSKKIALISFFSYFAFVIIDVNYGVFGSGAPKFAPMFTDGMSLIYINYNQIQKLFGAVFFLSFLFYIENKNELNIIALDTCAKYSFGIFFIHYYWIVILRNLFNGTHLSYIIISIVGFMASLISLYIFKGIVARMKLDSRIFVGC